MTERNATSGTDGSRRQRFRRQALYLASFAVAVYVGYLAFMIVKGGGA